MSGQNNQHHSPSLTVIQGDGVPSVEKIVGARTLNGKRGLILGMGLGGIAQGCLTVLSAFGASTAVAAINQKVLGKCEEFISECEFNVPAFLTCDVSKPGDVDILFSSLRSATGWDRLDFVVFSVAGAPKDEIKKPLKEATREGLTMALEISAFPLIELARNCEEMMTKGGTVISLGYLGEERVVEGYDLMAPVKAFLRTSMLYLAAELGPKNIRFHDVSPGPIPTRAASGLPGFNKLVESSETSGMLPGHVNIYDVGHMVAFLVSDAAEHMTAETIHVDLGTHAMGLSQDHGTDKAPEAVSAPVAKQAWSVRPQRKEASMRQDEPKKQEQPPTGDITALRHFPSLAKAMEKDGARSQHQPGNPGNPTRVKHSERWARFRFPETDAPFPGAFFLAYARESRILFGLNFLITGRSPEISKPLSMSEFQTAKPVSGDKIVRLETNHWTVVLRFFPSEAPKAVENFLTLSEKGYYDGIIFHRVIRDFMIQGGDPTGSGRGGKSAFGHEFENEISPKLSHIVGALSMANAGPDTNGSQFFIVHGRPARYLDGDYSIFGQVIEGQETVDAIANLPVDRNDKPKVEAKIIKATVETVS